MLNPKGCQAKVSEDQSYRMRQCRKPATLVDDDTGKRYCATHLPANVREREARADKAREAKWSRERVRASRIHVSFTVSLLQRIDQALADRVTEALNGHPMLTYKEDDA